MASSASINTLNKSIESISNSSQYSRSWEEEPLEDFLEMEKLCSDESFDIGGYEQIFVQKPKWNGIYKPSEASKYIGRSSLPGKANSTVSRKSFGSDANASNTDLGELIEVSEPSDDDDEDSNNNNYKKFNDSMEAVDYFISKGEHYDLNQSGLPSVSQNRVKILKNFGQFSVLRDIYEK